MGGNLLKEFLRVMVELLFLVCVILNATCLRPDKCDNSVIAADNVAPFLNHVWTFAIGGRQGGLWRCGESSRWHRIPRSLSTD